jgi:hypothetical protein
MPLEFFETALSHGHPHPPKPFAEDFPFLGRRVVLPELPDAVSTEPTQTILCVQNPAAHESRSYSKPVILPSAGPTSDGR